MGAQDRLNFIVKLQYQTVILGFILFQIFLQLMANDHFLAF